MRALATWQVAGSRKLGRTVARGDVNGGYGDTCERLLWPLRLR